MNTHIALLEAVAYTPDGAIADPNHPIYIILWVLKAVA